MSVILITCTVRHIARNTIYSYCYGKGMRDVETKSPDPTLPAAALWLKSIDRAYLHELGWKIANQRFHGLTMAARPFITKHFEDTELQEAAFDGMTLALLALAHFEDIESLAELFTDPDASASEEIEKKKKD
jgi:hypothetical protein